MLSNPTFTQGARPRTKVVAGAGKSKRLAAVVRDGPCSVRACDVVVRSNTGLLFFAVWL
jgi:hypothetical protein